MKTKLKRLLTLTLISILSASACWADANDDLFAAINQHDAAGVRQALRAGADVNLHYKALFNDTPLSTAIQEECSIEIVNLLLQAGADVNAKNDHNGRAILFIPWGINRSAITIAELLIKAGADVNAADIHGTTPLMKVARWGTPAEVELLLKSGADPRIKDSDGHDALWHLNQVMERPLVEKQSIEKMLKSVDRNNVDRNKELFTAIKLNDFAKIKEALQAGANVNAREEDELGRTPLLWAAEKCTSAVVETLLKAGADVNATSNSGFTALILAAATDKIDNVKILLEAGADINAETSSGYTPLMGAAERGSSECVQLLVQAGANVNAEQKNGITPLIYAMKNRTHKIDDIAMLLIKAGANIYWKDRRDGVTTLMAAAYYGSPELVKLFLKAGVDARATDNNGNNALWYANQSKKLSPSDKKRVSDMIWDAMMK